VHRYTCTRPLHCNVHSVYGPRTRLPTWLLPGCVKARYGAVYMDVYGPYTDVYDRSVHGPCTCRVHGRVPGRFRSRTRLVHLHASAAYTARRRRTTVLYTACVHLYTCTRPCAGRVRAVSARVNGRVRAVYTTGRVPAEHTARVHVYTYTAVNGPCTRPCTGRVGPVHARKGPCRNVYTAVYVPFTRRAVYAAFSAVDRASTWPCNSRVLHSSCTPIRVYTAVTPP